MNKKQRWARACIVAQLGEDDELAAALACRRLREAVAATERRLAGARLSTTICSVFSSVGKLEWAVSSCGLPLRDGLLSRAARGGQLEQLSWLCAQGCVWEPCKGDGEDPCSSAAEGGHMAVLLWLYANGCPWDASTCNAAWGGHLAVLQWLHEKGLFRAAGDLHKSAAEGRHVLVLQWLDANGFPCDEMTWYAALENGHLDVVQWLHAKVKDDPWAGSCLWDEDECMAAAFGGHLDVLQWLHASGCPWDSQVCSLAAAHGHEAVLDWARANGCPEEEPGADD
jgi:hypothetical protein